ncbi:MAG: hypothetical protein IJT88_04915 [Kiritimatiellae bacterium]|nr:hypothetical protein [Kiritimatiellia bacterium]
MSLSCGPRPSTGRASSAIEPVIGHVREDHLREGRCRLARAAGDALHALLTAVGFNLRKLMKGLKRLFCAFFHAPFPWSGPLFHRLPDAAACAPR